MIPVVGYVTWNRMGMTVQNLDLLLKTTDDFELYIVDNCSTDDTWDYLQTVKDPRIKEIKKFDKNYGLIYALNYTISKRKENQPFINVDQDVSIHTPNWIENCENTLKEFPEIGVLGNVRPTYFEERSVKYKELVRNNVKFWRTGHLMGCCMYFPSKTLDQLGYFSEELYLADIELNARMSILGAWVGYCPANLIMYSHADCSVCNHKNSCTDPKDLSCFEDYKKGYKHHEFYNKSAKKLREFKRNLTKNTLFCGSIHDSSSQQKYNLEEAIKNFEFYGGKFLA